MNSTPNSVTPMYQRRGAGTSSSRTQGTSGNGHFNNMHNRGFGDVERGSRNGLTSGEANKNILEQQNNERIDELSQQVARLKGLTIDIGNEVREQNSFLDNMGDGFESTRDMLSGSLRRIGTMLESGGAKHMCYMVSFVVFVVVFLYWLMSYKGTSGA